MREGWLGDKVGGEREMKEGEMGIDVEKRRGEEEGGKD